VSSRAEQIRANPEQKRPGQIRTGIELYNTSQLYNQKKRKNNNTKVVHLQRTRERVKWYSGVCLVVGRFGKMGGNGPLLSFVGQWKRLVCR
jgi:hypothetical protein